MMYCKLLDGVVVEVADFANHERQTECPDGVQCGWIYDGDTFAEPLEMAQRRAKMAAIDAIYQPVEYNGKLYPADPESMAKYEMAKQSKGRGKAAKGLAIAVDGSILKLSTPAAIDAFHAAMEDAIVARLNAAHDAL